MNEKCAEFERQVSSALDGEATLEGAELCHQHLNNCERCRGLREQLMTAREVLRSAPRPQPPARLLEDIKADAEQELRRHERVATLWARWRTPAMAVGAAAAVLLAVMTPWRAEETQYDMAEAPAVVELPVDAPVTPAPEADTAIAEAEVPVTAAEEHPAEIAEVQVAAAPATRAIRSPQEVPPAPAAAVPSVEATALETVVPPEEPAPVAVEPQVAFAPPGFTQAAAPTGQPVLTRPRTEPSRVAPRITMAAEPPPAPVGPSRLERELADGIVARIVIDKFIADQMLETPATLLAVITDTPTSELGPVLTEEVENGGFGLSFTDAMRRALTEKENQLP